MALIIIIKKKKHNEHDPQLATTSSNYIRLNHYVEDDNQQLSTNYAQSDEVVENSN